MPRRIAILDDDEDGWVQPTMFVIDEGGHLYVPGACIVGNMGAQRGDLTSIRRIGDQIMVTGGLEPRPVTVVRDAAAWNLHQVVLLEHGHDTGSVAA